MAQPDPPPMQLNSPHAPSIIGRATAFVVLVCLSLVLLEVWQAINSRQAALHDAAVTTTNLANAVAQHAEDSLKQADTLLTELVERYRVDGTDPVALDRLQLVLMARVRELPQVQGLFILDELGWPLSTSLDENVARANYLDREYFRFHMDHATPEPYIGPPIVSRTSGNWVMTISRRLEHPDGSFAGIALATIKINYLRKFHDQFNIGEKGAILLALDDGTLLTRRPFNTQLIGMSIGKSELFRDYVSQATEGTANLDSSIDNVRRIVAFRRLNQYPVVALAGLSSTEVLQGWRSETFLHGGAVAVLVAFLAMIGSRMIAQIQLRNQTYRELLQTRDALQFLNQKLEEMALQDGLTGLANRRHFDIALQEEFRRAARSRSSLALIMIDADNFKQFNDIYGHAAGDDCLKAIADAIRSCQRRSGDLAARYGGEEMTVILPETGIDGAVVVAERIRKAVEELGIIHQGNAHKVVTISLGVYATVPQSDKDPAEHLIEAADRALYLAKSGGRNRVCTLEAISA